jgi:hypothetical protein
MGWVYFATRDNGSAIKIGFSNDPVTRVGALGATLIAAMPGELADEKALHERFASKRIAGEWFHSCPELLDVIGEASALGDPSKLDCGVILHIRIGAEINAEIDRLAGYHFYPEAMSRGRRRAMIIRRALEDGLRCVASCQPWLRSPIDEDV